MLLLIFRPAATSFSMYYGFIIVNGTGVSFKKKAFILVHLLTEAHYQQKNPKRWSLDSWQAPIKPPAYGRGIPPSGRCRKPRTAVQVSAFPAIAWSLHRHRVQLIEEALTLSHQDLDGFTHQHIWRQDTRRLH